MRARARLLTIVGAVLLLVGCASVPTSGPIRQGPVVDAGASTQFIRVIAAPPSAGALPAEVVSGFLEASASLEDGHGIARQYLTPTAAERWAPDQRTTIYSLESLKVTGSGARVRATMEVTGELLANGTLLTVDPAQRRRVDLKLAQVGQGSSAPPEWRIENPPDELLVSDTDLRRAYREHQVYFVSSRTGILIPDGRMLPVGGSALPTALARQVLAGPSQWLVPGVVDTVPKGTRLALGAVTVADSVATVELTSDVVAATPKQREALAAQLTWTLTALPDIGSVQIMVAGSPLDFPGASLTFGRTDWQEQAPDAPRSAQGPSDLLPTFRLVGHTLVRTTDLGTTTVALPAEMPEDLATLAVSLDEHLAALTERDGGALWLVGIDGRSSSKRIVGSDMQSASFDLEGALWYASGGTVHRLDRDGTTHTVTRPEGPSAPVTGVRVAADGTRVALIADGHAELAVVEEGSDGQVALRSAHQVTGGISAVTDVSWHTATELDVLGETATGQDIQRVTLASGQWEVLRSPTGTVDIASAPGVRTLARTAEGQVLGNLGLQWRPQGDADAVAYSG